MTTVKVKLRTSSLPGKAGSLYFSFIHRGKSVQYTTKLKIFPEEWGEFSQSIIFSNSSRDKELGFIAHRLREDLLVFKNIIENLEEKHAGNFSVNEIVQTFKSRTQCSFFSFMDEQIAELFLSKRFGTARNYQCTQQSLRNFVKGREVIFEDFTEEFIRNYNHWLKSKGVTRNAISFYMRTLRALYNKASRKYFFAINPIFNQVYTGVDRTRKRAMSESVIFRLLKLELAELPALQYTRDLFLFSFYARGMAFVDMAYLKKTDIKNGSVTYMRRKTGKILSIRLEKCMMEIIDRYLIKTVCSDYLFPIISSDREDSAYVEYKNGLCNYNKQLKKIARLLGLPSYYFSSYVARHTWATIARNKNVPVSTISAGMGHGSETTTQIYLASLETSVIDEANRRILAEFHSKKNTRAGVLEKR